ncbi:hypothetical protein AgCh_000562 [Apium graveolens]
MALGRIPLVAFEIIEYQYSDRVLRQFGMYQHIPDDLFDHVVLRLERQSSFQRLHRLAMHQQYVAEWESYVATGGPEIVEGGFVSLAEYMQWYRRVSKMRIARYVPPEGDIIQPRDWYPQQMMGDALESVMKMTYMIDMHGPPRRFYDVIPDFLAHYDRVMTEWKGLGYSRPAFIKPKDIQQPHVEHQSPVGDAREDETGGPAEDTAVLVPPKRPCKEVQSTGDVPATHAPTHVSIPPQVEVQSTGDIPPATAPTPVSIASQVEVQSPANVPATTALTPVEVQSADAVLATPAPTAVSIPPQMSITPESLETSSSLVTPFVHLGMGESSVPSELWDMFDMDLVEDLAEDAAKRGETSERGVTYPLTHSQVKTLRPGYWVEDDVLNAYGELLRLREDKLWEKWEKIPRTESFKPRRYFIAPSFFMARALEHCPNLKTSPSTLKGDVKKSMEKFFRDYADKGGSLPLQFCDFAFFPTCDNSHWFLFVVNLNKIRVLNIDPIRDDKDTPGNIDHPFQYYIMEKLIPYMLKYMGVHGLDARPKQDGGIDCGVYVSKYMDAMLNGISLPSAVWNAKVDV